MTVSKDYNNALKIAFGGIIVQPDERNKHKHEVSRLCRCAMESSMFGYLKDRQFENHINIGGNPVRDTKKGITNVHYANYIMDANDEERQKKYFADLPKASKCFKGIQNCKCIKYEGYGTQLLTSVDSHYYDGVFKTVAQKFLQNYEIAKEFEHELPASSTEYWFTGWVFKENEKKNHLIKGESMIEVNNNQILMKVFGNHEPYKHEALQYGIKKYITLDNYTKLLTTEISSKNTKLFLNTELIQEIKFDTGSYCLFKMYATTSKINYFDFEEEFKQLEENAKIEKEKQAQLAKEEAIKKEEERKRTQLDQDEKHKIKFDKKEEEKKRKMNCVYDFGDLEEKYTQGQVKYVDIPITEADGSKSGILKFITISDTILMYKINNELGSRFNVRETTCIYSKEQLKTTIDSLKISGMSATDCLNLAKMLTSRYNNDEYFPLNYSDTIPLIDYAIQLIKSSALTFDDMLEKHAEREIYAKFESTVKKKGLALEYLPTITEQYVDFITKWNGRLAMAYFEILCYLYFTIYTKSLVKRIEEIRESMGQISRRKFNDASLLERAINNFIKIFIKKSARIQLTILVLLFMSFSVTAAPYTRNINTEVVGDEFVYVDPIIKNTTITAPFCHSLALFVITILIGTLLLIVTESPLYMHLANIGACYISFTNGLWVSLLIIILQMFISHYNIYLYFTGDVKEFSQLLQGLTLTYTLTLVYAFFRDMIMIMSHSNYLINSIPYLAIDIKIINLIILILHFCIIYMEYDLGVMECFNVYRKSYTIKFIIEVIISMIYDNHFVIFSRTMNMLVSYLIFGDIQLKNNYSKFAALVLALSNVQGKFGVQTTPVSIEIINQQCSINDLPTMVKDLVATVPFIEIEWKHTNKKNKITTINRAPTIKEGGIVDDEGISAITLNKDGKEEWFKIGRDLKSDFTYILPKISIKSDNEELFKCFTEGTNYECPTESTNTLMEKFPHFRSLSMHNYPLYLHRCERCLVGSCLRQFGGCANRIDLEIFEEYYTFVEQYIINPIRLCKQRHIDWQLWLTEVDSKKRALYIEHYENYNNTAKYLSDEEFIRKHVINTKIHTKTDEKIFIDPETNKMKERAIIEESDIMKVLMGPIVKSVTYKCKQIFSWYGSGLSNEERCIKFERAIDNLGGIDQVSFICLDGSAFDSCQHKEIKQALDHRYLLNELYDNILDVMKYAEPRHIEFGITNELKIVKGKVNNTSVELIIDGTVGSGYMNTSNGNTLRSGSYVKFAAHKANIIENVHFNFECCGDDIFIIIRRDKRDELVKALWKYIYAPKSGVTHGLGQIAKTIEITDNIFETEYLSCNLIINEYGKIKMIRKVERLMQLLPWSASVKSTRTDRVLKELSEFASCDYLELTSWSGDIEFFNTIANKIKQYHNINYNAKNYKNYNDRTDNRSGKQYRFNTSFNAFLRHKYKFTTEEISQLLVDIESGYMIKNLEKFYSYKRLQQKQINIPQDIYYTKYNNKTYFKVAEVIKGYPVSELYINK